MIEPSPNSTNEATVRRLLKLLRHCSAFGEEEKVQSRMVQIALPHTSGLKGRLKRQCPLPSKYAII